MPPEGVAVPAIHSHTSSSRTNSLVRPPDGPDLKLTVGKNALSQKDSLIQGNTGEAPKVRDPLTRDGKTDADDKNDALIGSR